VVANGWFYAPRATEAVLVCPREAILIAHGGDLLMAEFETFPVRCSCGFVAVVRSPFVCPHCGSEFRLGCCSAVLKTSGRVFDIVKAESVSVPEETESLSPYSMYKTDLHEIWGQG